MNVIEWTWGAVMGNPVGFLVQLTLAHDLTAFMTVLAVHLASSAVVASVAYLLLPARYRRPRVVSWLLMFVFAFVTPVVGAISLLLVTLITLRRRAKKLPHANPVAVELPEFDVQARDEARSAQGAIRSRLGVGVPAAVRMQSLLSLQAIPNRVSNPILEELLGDDTDDVRLVAFGMLDSEEKKISVHIQRERALLACEPPSDQRYACLRHLAELHWELTYAALAQGELRKHILGQARTYLDQALAIGVTPRPGLIFLKGRILLAQGLMAEAEVALKQAVAMGQPQISALPYLAEIAFERREFGLVRQFLQQLCELNVASKTRAIADLWAGLDNVNNFSDRRYLPHI